MTGAGVIAWMIEIATALRGAQGLAMTDAGVIAVLVRDCHGPSWAQGLAMTGAGVNASAAKLTKQE